MSGDEVRYELDKMEKMLNLMESLPEESRARVIRWLISAVDFDSKKTKASLEECKKAVGE